MAEINRITPISDNIFSWMDRYNEVREKAGFRRMEYNEIIEDAIRFYLTEELIELKALILNKED